mmetsp:Transcript_9286/g.17097  ORF Transcript_9286/g.17097 Transcript_9286/m.17097 type:complete len:124 (+) Transcript_9286:55-426(+)
MGNCSCRSCSTEQCKRGTVIELPVADDEVLWELDVPAKSHTESLDGQWYRSSDHLLVGEIVGHAMIWHTQWADAPVISQLQIKVDERGLRVSINMGQSCLEGQVLLEAQSRIVFSDTLTWLRK